MTHHKHHDDSQTLCPACEIGPFVRNHYFTGKLMLERDFTDEQRYFIEKLRHHHQRLHGWGVVCGLKVKQHENPACRDRYICIEPGTAIDCCGHEIVVREEECIDITQLPSIKALIDKKDDQRHTLQICLRYRECPTEEIPVLYDECGCDDTRCAPNRILESYDIDVIMDPPASEVPFHTPLLKWHCTIGPAHASRVALHAASRRLYMITADSAKTVFQLDTDNYTVVGAHALPEKGLELAVSNDGARVYVVTEGVGGVGDRQLVVLDTANNMGNAPISTSTIAQSVGNDIFLSVAPVPDNRLFALLGANGDVLVWPIELDTESTAPSPLQAISLGTNLKGLVIGSMASEGYTVDTTDNAIQVLDIAGNIIDRTITPSSPQTPFSQPSAVALVASTAPDMLAVVSESNKQLYLVGLNPDTLVGSVSLAHDPIALTVSPGGQWAYVLEQDAAGSFVQAVNLHRMQLHLSPVVGTPFKVGEASQQIVVSNTGAHLYIPFTDDMNNPVVGGVAVLDVSEQACEEILWRHLDGCPQCDTPNCVVLATIEHYQIGDKIEDQTDPPADPADDIARIDNRKGRQLLPSTQVLRELIECLMEQGSGGTGTQGPPGQKGDKGDPGLTGPLGHVGPAGPGFERGLTRIEALSWSHNVAHLTTSGTPTFIVSIQRLSQLRSPGIVIGFTSDVQVTKTIDADHVFQILVDTTTDLNKEKGIVCRCAIRGTTIPVDFELDTDGRIKVDQQGRIAGAVEAIPGNARGVAFLFEVNGILNDIGKEIINSKVPELWVILRGDFIKDKEDRSIDAEFVRAELPTGDRPKPPAAQSLADQLGIQGGTFESWFFISQD